MNITATSSPYPSPQLADSGSAASVRTSPAQAHLVLPKFEMPTRESLNREMASFAEKIRQKFQAAGIQTPPNPILSADFQGHVRVENDHPDKDKIEQLFIDNPDLQQAFIKISSDSSLLRAAEHYSAFTGAYEKLKDNPAAQRSLVESEIARNNAPFYMEIKDGGIVPFFGISGISV